MDDLVADMEGAFAVTENNIHGQHPHFSDYKNEGKISEGQRARREQFIQRQAEARDSIRDRFRSRYDKNYEVKSDEGTADESMDSTITTAEETLRSSATPSIVSESGQQGVDKKISTDSKFMGAVTDGFEGMDFSKWGLPGKGAKKGKKPPNSQNQQQEGTSVPTHPAKASNNDHAGVGGASRRAQQQNQKQLQQASYADSLMFSEWLVDIPGRLDTEWIMVPCPVGKRCLVVAFNGFTSVYNKTGYRLAHFQTEFVGGNRASAESYTLLDCILGKGEKKYYVLDLICWAGEHFSDKEFTVRRAFLQAKFDEMPQLSELAPDGSPAKFTFHRLPSCECTVEAMTALMQADFQYPLDGLLFYYSKVYYTPGQTPLVGWLKPWMLPEILQVEIPMKFICEQGFYTSSRHFIERFNEKHRFRSSIPKPNDDVENTNGQTVDGSATANNNENDVGGMDVVLGSSADVAAN